jgi:hypothetical protein
MALHAADIVAAFIEALKMHEAEGGWPAVAPVIPGTAT